MTYYGGKELAHAFRTVRKNTIQIAEDIPGDKYDFKASPESRTIAQTLVHIAVATTFPTHLHGNKISDMTTVNWQEIFDKIAAEEGASRTKAETLTLLTSTGEKFAALLETFTEPFLGERLTFAPGADPPSRTRFDMLLAAKEHEMHHRGQLMMMERMVGVVPHLTRQMQERRARLQAMQQQPTK